MSDIISGTILKQLGANRFIAMTGAKNLLGLSSGLSFKLPGRGQAKDNITYVRIKLNGNDLYDIEFAKLNKWGEITKVVKTLEDVYAEDLQRLFTEVTGLRTRL